MLVMGDFELDLDGAPPLDLEVPRAARLARLGAGCPTRLHAL